MHRSHLCWFAHNGITESMAGMITLKQGNLLMAPVEALVNTVNTRGVMGKGIALQFRQAFPENYKVYHAACRRNEVIPGRMLVVPTNHVAGPRLIINFPTKRHWKGKSRLEDIDAGLVDLLRVVREYQIMSIAIPPLGCGNGGLDWDIVRPRIESSFATCPEVDVWLYEPEGALNPDSMPVGTSAPNMTPAQAALLGLMARYAEPGYRMSMIEIQKLAYLLQSAGENLKLEFVRGQYGPYAETIHHVLQRLEGHHIRGYGDRSDDARITLLNSNDPLVQQQLAANQPTMARFDRVADLIDGFETPRGLELLTTVAWVSEQDPTIADDADLVIAHVHAWNAHKRTFPANQIRTAWERLHEHGWMPTSTQQ